MDLGKGLLVGEATQSPIMQPMMAQPMITQPMMQPMQPMMQQQPMMQPMQPMMQPAQSVTVVGMPGTAPSHAGPEVFVQNGNGSYGRAGTMTITPNGKYGNSPRIQGTNGGPAPVLLHKAKFDDSCLDCLLPGDVKSRQYAYIWDNKLELNYPFGIFGCLTCSEKCVTDRVSTIYFDRSPIRTGMTCYVIPTTCCGPPVIFAKEPFLDPCDIISLAPCCVSSPPPQASPYHMSNRPLLSR